MVDEPSPFLGCVVVCCKDQRCLSSIVDVNILPHVEYLGDHSIAPRGQRRGRTSDGRRAARLLNDPSLHRPITRRRAIAQGTSSLLCMAAAKERKLMRSWKEEAGGDCG